MRRQCLLLYCLGLSCVQPVICQEVSAPAGAASNPAGSQLPYLNPSDSALMDMWRAQIANQNAQAAYYAKQVEPKQTSELAPWQQTVLGSVLAIAAGIVTAWWTAHQAAQKSRREQERTYQRQKGQLRLATTELLAALQRIPGTGPAPGYLSEKLLYLKPVRPTVPDRNDPYYQKYDLVDTVYRFCAFLGWLEIFRTDSAFLRGTPDETSRIETNFKNIRASLADPLPVDASSAQPVRDGFILEDDQRAIGEKMMVKQRGPAVLGYAAFCETLFRDPAPHDPVGNKHRTSQNWWIWNATRFFVELEEGPGTDLKRRRLTALTANLQRVLEACR